MGLKLGRIPSSVDQGMHNFPAEVFPIGKIPAQMSLPHLTGGRLHHEAFLDITPVRSAPPAAKAHRDFLTSFVPTAGVVYHAPVDDAEASSVYTTGTERPEKSPFSPRQALEPGFGYWCSKGD